LGRTIPTANMQIEQEIAFILKRYGRALDTHEREVLNGYLQLSKKHTQACSQAVRRVPIHGVLMAIIFEQEKQLRNLTNEIANFLSDDGGGI